MTTTDANYTADFYRSMGISFEQNDKKPIIPVIANNVGPLTPMILKILTVLPLKSKKMVRLWY